MQTVELARQQIDEEIELLLRPVRALKTKRNALAPIHKLPPEILSEIFVYAQRYWDELTGVCSHWRCISLQCSSLWNQLFDPYHSCREWTEIVLKRSRNTPIDLTLKKWREPTASTDLALRQAPRARRISISGDRTFIADATNTMSCPAPLLEVLRINRRPENEHDPPLLLPHSFCHGSPRLQSLELIRCSLCWDRPFSDHLTYFSITRPSSRDAPPRLTISQLLRILGEAPALESLMLVDALREGPVDVVPANLRVSLPRLHDLRHEDDISTSIFLRHLVFPSSATFCVDWNVDSVDSNAAVSAALGAFQETRVRSANQIVVRGSASSLTIAYEALNLFPFEFVPGTFLKLSLRFRSEWEYASLLSVLIGRFEFADLFKLSLSGGDVEAEDGDGYLATLDVLKIIHAGGDACYGLVEALAVAKAPEAIVPVPGLKELHLSDEDLDEGMKDMLDECLQSRHAHGVGIGHLKFLECDCTAFQSDKHVVIHFSCMGSRVDYKAKPRDLC
ncbi:hypothetical protein PLICRDRAFT_44292 [Plicaturopsis crispa FD-325 SS-3]|nr:hypothetical protein PLICRDRAFT_44292 [Plicaturopsis crispa FD-325 SS-3]